MVKVKWSRLLAASVAMAACLSTRATAGDAAGQAAGATVLSERHYWRKHYTFFPPKFASTQPAATNPAPARKQTADSLYAAEFCAAPPADWKGPDFDDGPWLLRRGREFVTGDGRLMQYTTLDAADGSTCPRRTGPLQRASHASAACRRMK